MKIKLFDLRGVTFKERAHSLKENLVTKIAMGILRPFFWHRLIHLDRVQVDTDNPIVYIGNHAEIYGPITSVLNLPYFAHFWVINRMMFDPKDVRDYLYENTFSKIRYLIKPLQKALAAVLGRMSVYVMNALQTIAVYRDSPMKLRQTLRQSVEAMEKGESLMIFPEHPDGKYEKAGISDFSPGFLMLAEAWWKKTGKKLRILPIYANRLKRTFTFGNEICYKPENGFAAEQERILREARNQMIEMAGIAAE